MSWKTGKGFSIDLISPEQLSSLKDGTVLYNIFGEEKIVGKDNIDGDTRGGYLAYGFKQEKP